MHLALNGGALKVQAPTFALATRRGADEDLHHVSISYARAGGELYFKARGFSPVICVLMKAKE